jgi:hypothetical protein
VSLLQVEEKILFASLLRGETVVKTKLNQALHRVTQER